MERKLTFQEPCPRHNSPCGHLCKQCNRFFCCHCEEPHANTDSIVYDHNIFSYLKAHLTISDSKVINELSTSVEQIKTIVIQLINTIFSQIIAKMAANTPKAINISMIDDGTKQIINDIIQNKSITYDAYRNQMESNRAIKNLVEKSQSIMAALSSLSIKLECPINLKILEESFANLDKIASQLKLPPSTIPIPRDNSHGTEISNQQKSAENKMPKKAKPKAAASQRTIESIPSTIAASINKESPITLKIQVPPEVIQLPLIADTSSLTSNFTSFKRPFPDINETTPVKKKNFITTLKGDQSINNKERIELLLIDYKNNVKTALKNQNLETAHILYVMSQLLSMPLNFCQDRLSI